MRIVGQLVCGHGEADRWLEETLKDFERMCDDVLVATCNAGPKELKLLKKYDFRHYADDREWGKHQPSIKTDLLKRINKMQADWVLVLDADETVPTLNRQLFEELAGPRDAMQLYVTNLWNDEHHYMRSLSFWNVRAYRPGATTETQFLKKPVHCGNAPPYFYTLPAKETYVPHVLQHKGLMLESDRLRKVERYNKYDPNAIHKGREYYDALTAVSSGTIYDKEVVQTKLKNYVSTL